MTYRRKNNNKVNVKLIVISIIILTLVFWGSYFNSLTHFIAVPIITIKNVVISPFDTILNQFKSKQSLIDQNENLFKENQKLQIENLTIKSLQKENDSLKQLIGYLEPDTDYKTAKVLSRPPFSPYDTFILDLGSDDVFVGDRVFYLGVLIGSIEETYFKSSVVRLLSSAGQSFFVTVTDQQVEARGLGGGGFVLSLPRDLNISEDEVIFIDQKPIGQIDEIITDENSAFQNIYFRYPFNLDTIDFVEIINLQQ